MSPGAQEMRTREVPASIGQRLLWLKAQHEGVNTPLNCPLLCEVEGPLDLSALRTSLTCLITTHESLRTTFVLRGRELRQIILPSLAIEERFHDLSLDGHSKETIQALIRTEINTYI